MQDNSTSLPGYLLVLNWPVYVPGGVNEAVLGLAQNLKSRGYQSIVGISTWSKDPQPPRTRDIEVVSLRLREPFAQGSGFRLLPGFFSTFASDVGALLTLLRSRNIRVVNSYFPSLDVGVIFLLQWARAYKGKFVFTFQGADIGEISQSTGLARWLWQFLITRADGVVACSDALRKDVVRFAPKARVTTIHNGVDLSLFDQFRQPRVLLRRILHIGKFEHKKSQDVLLRAFKNLVGSIPDAFLILIGAEGPELSRTRALITELQLEKRVELHVNVPHERLPEFMAQADLFVLPSRAEPFGIVLLEAGAAGLPVVATRVGGIPELIENERTGLLIAPESVEELEASMKRLLTDVGLAERLGRSWHDQVVSTWSWEVTCRKYLDLVESV